MIYSKQRIDSSAYSLSLFDAFDGRTRPSTFADGYVVFILIGLIYAGYFKSAIAFPYDLTLMFAVLVTLCAFHEFLFLGSRTRLSKSATLFVGLFIPAMFYPTVNAETITTRARLLLSLLACIGVVCLLRNSRRLRAWVWAQVIVGILLVATGGPNAEVWGRFTGAGTNTIGTGRVAGAALLILALIFIWPTSRPFARITSIVIAAPIGVALLYTGSRGPTYAMAISLIVVIVLSRSFVGNRVSRCVMIGAPLALILLFVESSLSFPIERLTMIEGDSWEGRLTRWSIAIRGIAHHPFGVGWGNYWSLLPNYLQTGPREYPHNIVLNVAVEAGWAAGCAMIAFMIRALYRIYRHSTDFYGAALYALAIFFTLNAMVSGDLSDNRMMWAALTISWTAPLVRINPDYDDQIVDLSARLRAPESRQSLT